MIFLDRFLRQPIISSKIFKKVEAKKKSKLAEIVLAL